MILENTYLQQLKQADPELADLFWNFAYMEVPKEKGQELGEKTRYLAILATLLGCQGGELFREILSEALYNGVTAIEAKEVVYQAVAYLGIGRVFLFIKITNEVMENLGIHLPLENSPLLSRKLAWKQGNKCRSIFLENASKAFMPPGRKKHAISIVGWPVTALEITTPEPVWM